MLRHLSANLWLAGLTLLLGSVLYPLALFGVGQTLFPFQAQGSLVDKQGHPTTDPAKAVGSRLIGQPFSPDSPEYFQPRPSATSPAYNAAASGASCWGASSYQLRYRVARALGPMVKYSGGPKKGQPVGPDVESWFREDRYQGKPGIVARWASDHGTLAQIWVKADPLNSDYVTTWLKDHPSLLADWKKENPGAEEPKPEDLAVPFFVSFSKEHPGKWPTIVEHKTAAGATEKRVESVSEGTDIQAGFFDMWRQEHPEAELQEVPADLVMASGSGLDPDITLAGAMYQLDRVAAAWAAKTHQPESQLRHEIEAMLQKQATEPLGGLVGVKLINVLEINLALSNRYGAAADAKP